MSEQSTDRDWAAYYARTGDRPPRETLTFALDQFDAETGLRDRFAVDLGAGGGAASLWRAARARRGERVNGDGDRSRAVRMGATISKTERMRSGLSDLRGVFAKAFQSAPAQARTA